MWGIWRRAISNFPYRWLRDSCQCPSCVHPSTRQKLHASSDIPRHVQPAAPVKLSNNALHVRWTGHKMDSVYDRAFLKAYATPVGTREMHGDEHLTAQGWTAAQLEAKPARFVAYEDLRNDPERRLVAFEHLAQTGLLLVTGVFHAETSNETCELRQLANVFGEIRHTFYGQTWNVVAKKGSTNIAYTSLFLGLHMDLEYFAHPPRLQLLHCLRNQVVGGTSLFVDALAAAEKLRSLHPEAFSLLASYPIPFHYQNDGHHLHYAHPTIELDPTSGAIRQLNYSPPFQAPLPADTPDAVFDALELFANTLEEDGRMFKYLLREGDAAVFDNRRVLHARDSFHDPMEDGTDDGEPMRWLKGCYVEADPLLDRARVLRKEILSNVASS
ncbi:Clavaminate synthase-like protein [Auriculariales sp. MPI-PUGE-AT-0066]|nr:Clavaminate synthase-like protein [Auriculariales sp. MPI-PUGE-AT-0066]